MPIPLGRVIHFNHTDARGVKRSYMRQLPNPAMIDPSIQIIAMVLRETLQRQRTYDEFFEFACVRCGSLPDEWGFDWRDLHGDVRRDGIDWANGTTWTKRPSDRFSRR
jgi:hypothetical protein